MVRAVTSTRTPCVLLGRNRGDAFMAPPAIGSIVFAFVFVVASTVLQIVGGSDRGLGGGTRFAYRAGGSGRTRSF